MRRFPNLSSLKPRRSRAEQFAAVSTVVKRMLAERRSPVPREPAEGPASKPVPPLADFVARYAKQQPDWAKSLPQAGIPDAVRELLDRLGRSDGALPGLDGLAGQPQAPVRITVPDGAKFEALTFANAAGSRPYKLYIPSGYSGETPVPLVVMLHGCTQSPDDFAAGTKMNDLAEEHGFLVAYPGQPPSANRSKCWNWFSAGDQQRDQGEPSILAGITKQVMQDHRIDPSRVYVAGLSAGGAAAAIMGVAYPDLYAAIGVHSGLACGSAQDLPSAFSAMKQGGPFVTRGSGSPSVPTIVFHGDRDTTVSPLNGDQVIAQSRSGAKLTVSVSQGQSEGGTAYTRSVQADGTGAPLLEQWVLHGTGHAWSGGSPAGSYTDPRGPDASREMVRFFLEHPRRTQPNA